MPRGTRHEIVGILLEDGGAMVLHLPGGGAWRLDLGRLDNRRTRRMTGRRVRVTGTRDDFDLLSVDKIVEGD